VTTFLVILIATVCLWAMVVATLLIVVRLRNRLSTPRSPTQSTTPTPTSDELVYKMMETMKAAYTDSTREMHEMVVDLTQGRESQSPSGQPEILLTPNERLSDYDYDSTPLSPGIEAVIERESQETEQLRIAREREELQRQLMEAQAELDRFDLESSSESGPWNGQSPRHANQEPT
jgi:hypothetical protein